MSQRNGGSQKDDFFQRVADRFFKGDRGLTQILFWVGIFFVPWLAIFILVLYGMEFSKGSREKAQRAFRQQKEIYESWTTAGKERTQKSAYTHDENGGNVPRYGANAPSYVQTGTTAAPHPARPKPTQQKPKITRPKHTGDKTADDLLNAGYDFLVAANNHLHEIRNPQVRAKVQTTCGKVRSIMNWIEEQPASAERAKKVTMYYLPTTQKLLRTYVAVDDRPGPNAQAICSQIDQTLDMLNKALTNLMDDLLGKTAMDVEAEIAVMEQMLGKEGLTDELRMPRVNQ